MTALELSAHYVTLPEGQVRIWRTGRGPDLVVLAGLTRAASTTAEIVAGACPGWRVTAIELPGIGGSSEHGAGTLEELTDTAEAVIAACGITACVLAAFELAGAIAAPLAKRQGTFIRKALVIGADRAASWARAGCAPPPLAPRQDGTHLAALWSFIRDRHLLEPADPTQPAAQGDPLPTAEELDATVTAAGVQPERFAALWAVLSQGIGATRNDRDLAQVETIDALTPFVAGLSLPPNGAGLPPTAPARNRIWCQYVPTPRGRMHIRRAGSKGRPVLVIPTGGGSSAQFAPVVLGLAGGSNGCGRQALSVDYLGNGLSDKLERAVTIGELAEDMLALIDALGFEEVDVWGSHTGALVGLELAVRHPERVGRAVLEGPVFIAPDFQSDLLAKYFPPIRPDPWGLHLGLVWNWRRDMFMYWPWYRVERSATRRLGVPSAQELHKYAIGILESGSHYDRAYRSAFAYDTRSRLALLKRPALICAGPNDMLVNCLAEAGQLNVPGVEIRHTPTTVWWPDPEPDAARETLAIYREFLDR
jgi:pimeloyl-ACP methyl ester carboxylesterase